MAAVGIASLGCGSCPEARRSDPSPGYLVSSTFDLGGLRGGADAGVAEEERSGSSFPVPCSAACRAVLLDPASSCQDACKALEGASVDLRGCGFDAARLSLTCSSYTPPTSGGCSCDLLDC